MDHLWAPWRLAYVAAAPKPTIADDCFICGDPDYVEAHLAKYG